jgi:isochorismate hydrolase
MTAIDAYQRDSNATIPPSAVGSYDRNHEAISLRYINGKVASVISLAAVA